MFHDNVMAGILLACMPKSGSSSLSKMIAGLPNVRTGYLVPDFHIREQEIDMKALDAQLLHNAQHGGTFVSQQHIVRSRPTQQIIDEGALFPLVQTRNLPDAVVSFVDHLYNDRGDGFILPSEYYQWPFQERAEFVIMFHLPWHLKFYKSWLQFRDFERVWIRYEDFRKDTAGTLMRIVELLELDTDPETVMEISDTKARFNKGVDGRGKAQLNYNQLLLIEQMIDFYEFPPDHREYLLHGTWN